jgi:hypothetical protein
VPVYAEQPPPSGTMRIIDVEGITGL